MTYCLFFKFLESLLLCHVSINLYSCSINLFSSLKIPVRIILGSRILICIGVKKIQIWIRIKVRTEAQNGAVEGL